MIKLFSTITMILLLWLTPDYNTSKPKEKPLTSLTPEKEYPVSCTIQEWIIVTSHPDDVAKNIREKVIQKIGSQLQSQLKVEDSLQKQKALQDSLKKKN